MRETSFVESDPKTIPPKTERLNSGFLPQCSKYPKTHSKTTCRRDRSFVRSHHSTSLKAHDTGIPRATLGTAQVLTRAGAEVTLASVEKTLELRLSHGMTVWRLGVFDEFFGRNVQQAFGVENSTLFLTLFDPQTQEAFIC